MRSPLRVSSSSRLSLVTPPNRAFVSTGAVHLTAIILSLALLAGCGGGDGIVLPGESDPAAIAVVDGNEQRGRVGEPLNEPVVVQVTDSRGRPVEGVTVAFDFNAAGAGAAVIPQEKTTDGDGLADARLVLGTTVGQQTGQARVVLEEGRGPIQASFSATALSENANSMTAVAGQDQTGHVGLPLDDRLVVEVTDGFGNPVAGVPISWEALGGGTVSEAIVQTDEDGRSRVDRILGPTVGPQATVASSEGLAGSPVTFVHTALSGDASRLVILSGNDQTAEAGSTLPGELVVQLIDAEGNGVPQTAVSWVVATGGGAAVPNNSITDADGRTSAQWTLGPVLGQQRLDAVVSGLGVATFMATAVAVAPPSLFVRIQPPPAARNGVPLTRQPVVQLRDPQGNDLAQAGVQVTAAIGSGGGELGGTRQVSTDASGQATFTNLSISGAPGRRTLIFTASGFAQATSSEIDLQAIGTSTTITGDSPDPSGVGNAFTVSFRVTSDGPTPTGSVTVGDGSQSCSGSLSNGTGSCQLALSTAGERTLTATYAGAPGFSASSDIEAHRVNAPEPDNEEPDADYNWHCEGLTCQFTDASEDDDGSVVSWSWNFGGTGTSNVQNPSHTFPGPGEYQVTLTVTDNRGASDASTAGVDVEAPPPPNQSPTAEFTWDCDELECDFESQSRDPDGRIEDHDWTFGDTGTSDDDDPEHRYSAGGTYQVTLTVTDNDGARSSVTHSVTATAPPANQAPTAAFTARCEELECEFDDDSRDDDGRIEDHDWTFGDGESSDDEDPDHTYPAAGTYQVTLTVTDNDGATGTTTRSVTVSEPNTSPTADFTVQSCTVGQPCQFTDASTDDGSIASRQWTFQDGDPATSTQASQSVTFASEGSKTVTLAVTDDQGATDSETKQVAVAPAQPQNQAPVAQDDAYTTPGGGESITVPTPGVLANDSDPDSGDAVVAQNASDPASGSVSLNSDGSFTYTPDLGASGTDSFTYEASDGALTAQATVTITITP